MKKYRQVLATLLAANLTVSLVTLDVSAGTTAVVVHPVSYSAQNEVIKNTSEDKTAEADSSSDSKKEETTDTKDAESDNSGKIDAKEDTSKKEEKESASKSDSQKKDDKETSQEVKKEVTKEAKKEKKAADARTPINLNDLLTDMPKDISKSGDAVTVNSRAAFILLSNCNASELQELNISVPGTGSIDLTGSITEQEVGDNQQYIGKTFNSFGTEEHPFKGSINVQVPGLSMDKPLFGTVESSAKVTMKGDISWRGKDSSVPLYAEHYIFSDIEEKLFPCTINGTEIDPKTHEKCTMGNLIHKITGAAGTLKVENKINYTNANIECSQNNSAGLICGSLEAGTINLDGYQIPDNANVTADTGNAGGLVGTMASDTNLIINGGKTTATNAVRSQQIAGLSVKATQGDAGSIVGTMQNQAQLKMTTKATGTSNITVSFVEPTIDGKNNAGGIAGSASKIDLNRDKDNVNFELQTPTLKTEGNAGGYFGTYILDDQEISAPEWIALNKAKNNDDVTIEITNGNKDSGNAGGYFGVLELKNSSKYTISKFDLCVNRTAGEVKAYGAIVGQVRSNDSGTNQVATRNSLFLGTSGTDKVSNVILKNNDSQKPKLHGGLIGEVGETGKSSKAVYVELNNCNITVQNPFAAIETEAGFGGAIGRVAEGSVVKTCNKIKITTEAANNKNDKKIWEGGGLIGSALAGSAIELTGETDLSGVSYVGNSCIGQLVAKQESALIYAKGSGSNDGWKYIRTAPSNIYGLNGGEKSSLDDIGNYGQVLRLGDGLSNDLININSTTHQVELKSTLEPSNNTFTIKNVDDFALMAITWQTRGYFSAYSGTSKGSLGDLAEKNIALDADINLVGTGITGLSRDILAGETPYTGTFNGNNKKITLATGEAYGYQGNINSKPNSGANSSGKVHRRDAIGIFAIVSGGKVNNLNIEGNIYTEAYAPHFSSTANTYSTITVDTRYAGGYAAQIQGGSSNFGIHNVTANEEINVSRESVYDIVKNVYVGGIAGECSAKTVNLGSTTDTVTLSPTINVLNDGIKNAGANFVYAAGAFGKASGNTVNCDSVNLAGTMTNASNSKAKMGALIALSDYGNTNTININKISIDGQNLTAGNATECGGLLGYLWADTTVNFQERISGYSLEINQSQKTTGVSAAKASVGGLVYRASGKWIVNDHGINMAAGTFNAKNLGLLVCHAENDENEKTSSGEAELSRQHALYLNMVKNWKTAYQLTKDVSANVSGVYDELVAYTAKDAENITENNKNGIISLATENNAGVATENLCNTYQNRTNKSYDNPNSRYYYNLDSISGKTSLTDAEYLLLWSVYTYASNSLKNEFSKGKNFSLAGSQNQRRNFDMKGLSYYPVNISNVWLEKADITFYNNVIEEQEKTANNKKTTGTATDHSQHYMMHCGLFYNLQGSDSQDVSSTIADVSFAGSVGVVNNGSGALLCGNVSGNDTNRKFHSLHVSQIELKGLTVTDAQNKSYAPVFMNSIGSYTTTRISVVSTSGYAKNTVAGTSFIGNAGSATTNQISLTFNNMKLPDKPATSGGIFTRASFLEKFQYMDNGVGTAIYTFNKEEDWSGTTHTHDVTYGKEISNSVQYPERQRWYYNEETYKKDDGLVKDEGGSTSFEEYLSYVANVDSGTDSTNNCHEIMVNQRVSDLLTGCGTYGHPYVIKDSLEMDIISEYLASATPREGWKIRITNDQTKLEGTSGQEDDTYIYSGGTWRKAKQNGSEWQVDDDNSKTLDNTKMHRYLLSAYYDIQGQNQEGTSENGKEVLELDSFSGFGSELYPFRGVLTSTNEHGCTIIMKGSGGSRGLIPYSYGSVVKNLTIQYSGEGKTVSYNNAPASKTIENTQFESQAFFGGVIGCIVGGDNIIDGVKVDMDTSWKLKLSGEYQHLIQVGGYVGSVSGGGVIFRNMTSNTGMSMSSVDSGGKNYLYVNPYVGRVLDGYAFSEGCSINNTNNNYKINEINTDDKCIETTSADGKINTEIKDAQGLLIMSALVNSGGVSGGNTYTYKTTSASNASNGNYSFGNGLYGKVRNATYNYIGKKDQAQEDFKIALKDDTESPSTGNAPYLATKYSNSGDVFELSTKKATVELVANTTYNMADYGNGYQGISARYLSSALNTGESNKIGGNYVIPRIAGFEGNNATILTNINVREYADDDFHGISFGGVFNLLRGASADQISDKVLAGNLNIGAAGKETKVTLQYCDKNGTNVNSAAESFVENEGRYCVSVGGFAGNTAANGFDVSGNTQYTIQKMNVQNATITGPNSVGGIMGSIGMGNDNLKQGVGILLHDYLSAPGGTRWVNGKNNYGFNFVDCQYSDSNINAGYLAGGFAGHVTSGVNSMESVADSGLTSFIKVTSDEYETVGDLSIITTNTATGIAAGGIFGKVDQSLNVQTDNSQKVTLKDLTISAYKNAGGIVALFSQKTCIINNVYIIKGEKNTSITGKLNAGGVAGYIADVAKILINNCHAEDVNISGPNRLSNSSNDTSGAGGIAGTIQANSSNDNKTNARIDDCTVSTSKQDAALTPTNAEKTTVTCEGQAGAGGILGYLKGSQRLVMQGCKVENLIVGAENAGYNGGLLGTMANNGSSSKEEKLSLHNSSVTDVEVKGKEAGGLSSSVFGTIDGSNLLVNSVKISGSETNANVGDGNKSGILIGGTGNKDNVKQLYLSGVSVQGTNVVNSKGTISYKKLTDESSFNFGTNAFITFADYTGASLSADTMSNTAGTEKDSLLGQNASYPYVTTSPKSALSVYDNDQEKYLFGDGASWTADSESKFTVNGEKIFNEKKSESTTTLGQTFTYDNTGVTEFDFAGAFSSYNANQTSKIKSDFPVLQITGGETANLQGYLNILTNGGYSQAKAIDQKNTQKIISYSVDSYEYDNNKAGFVNKGTASTLRVDADGTFRVSSDYDNDKNRFTLLTVTFNDAHRVQIPIVVRRVLEVDFYATLSYGTNFKKENYKSLTNHVLESFGNSMTAYLTYKYNSAKTEYTDYGWESYINAGGNVAQPMEKTIDFGAEIPEGTQLTLIDCQDSKKKAYYYTVTAENAKKSSFSMTLFKDSKGEAFASPSIGELMHVSVNKDAANGTFITVEKNDSPTVCSGENYYRLPKAGEDVSGKTKYSIAMGDLTKCEENYYLVVTVPDKSGQDAVNGSIQTTLNGNIPYNMNYLRRDNNTTDGHYNTASTYQLFSGYQQELEETLGNIEQNKRMSAADSDLKIALKNKITFSNAQFYNVYDELYQNFVGNLQTVKEDKGTAAQFPSGTNGTAKFYVYKEDDNGTKTYYTYDSASKKWNVSKNGETEALSYDWTSDGSNMNLPLSTDGTIKNAVSLQQVRDMVRGDNNTTGSSSFYVEVKLDASIPAIGLDVIPKSSLTGETPNEYAKTTYISQLSTEKDSLTYSNTKATLADTRMKYYREDTANAKLKYDADDINQLGINLLDLEHNLDKDQKHAVIATTATYDLSDTKNLEEVLKTSTGVRFKMTLKPKDTAQKEDYATSELDNAREYMDVQLVSASSGSVSYNSGTWSWTIPKESYYDGALKKNGTIFDGDTFTQAIRLLVNVDNVESAEHLYSNYYVDLTAEVIGEKNEIMQDTSANDYVIYTLTKIKPSFQN